jgi:hypothetical protein
MSWEQNLVNAQVSVNRSVWAMNAESEDRENYPGPGYIIQETREAIKSLTMALEGLTDKYKNLTIKFK